MEEKPSSRRMLSMRSSNCRSSSTIRMCFLLMKLNSLSIVTPFSMILYTNLGKKNVKSRGWDEM